MLRVCFLFVFLCVPAFCFARDPQPGTKPVATAKEETEKTEKMPVGVEHSGQDVLGQTLALRFKEAVNQSGLYDLSLKEEPKIKVLITTSPEFGTRPQVGSVYSVVWIFSSGTDVLTYYLNTRVGVTDATTLDATVNSLAAETARIVEKYIYLFE